MMNDDYLLPTLLAALIDPESQENIDNLYALIVKYLDKTAEENGKPFDDESYDIIKTSLRTMLEPLLPVIKADFFATIDNGDGSVSISDVTEIQRYLADFGNPYHIGESVGYDEYELPFVPDN